MLWRKIVESWILLTDWSNGAKSLCFLLRSPLSVESVQTMMMTSMHQDIVANFDADQHREHALPVGPNRLRIGLC